jgi:hypothetical protein
MQGKIYAKKGIFFHFLKKIFRKKNFNEKNLKIQKSSATVFLII